MASLNIGLSTYHSIQGLFCRNKDEKLLSIEDHAHVIREIFHTSKQCYVGLISCQPITSEHQALAFREWIEIFFLLNTSLCPELRGEPQHDIEAHNLAERITKLFEDSIRNTAASDEWMVEGRHLFFRQVLSFILRNERLQFGLPAFPCKSPNTRKVGGSYPDMAERIALETLRTFTRDIQTIYSPGATLWIISDGHVFADCIGVNDDMVSIYDENLKQAYQSMFDSREDREAIRFQGLNDMLQLNGGSMHPFSHNWTENMDVSHPIETNRSKDAELSRKVMMAACGISKDHLRKLISAQDPAVLQLYRGQSRFMLDDLATPEFCVKSTKQKKKIASAVAAEMIARNQAYSNLLELLLPNYIRLSIHAHSNRGPKFGIRLFPIHRVRAIDSVDNRHELVPAYEFQLPTPWHNCIIKVDGDKMLYLGKAEIAREAIANGEYQGAWVDGPGGGHFALHSKRTELLEYKTISESTTEIVEVPANDLSKNRTTHSFHIWWFYPFVASSIRFVHRIIRMLTGNGFSWEGSIKADVHVP
ncbi:uncharacterized protein BDR25DRAFT_331588 [Lindgomyces ingoldianus]|uniref:Uncharacterized protein n=1 Tax=Lindgomyces ingoldianus TaxID=673940 RepID=A0ACB6RC18_9PLEO|nr:uncharacterized protein BDR25DRAFT_331588 [Lindgomyces ingoldianus]KAF2475880.1 hypothetical protein BDR25DRAFT_331588 [Lindgomyces ingoldianus]